MPAKLPYQKWFWADWFQDTRCLSFSARGVWIDMIGHLREKTKTGSATHSYEDWGKLLVGDVFQIQSAVAEWRKFTICRVVENGDGTVTVSSRRIMREKKARQNANKRTEEYRDKQAGDAAVTDSSRPGESPKHSQSHIQSHSQSQKQSQKEEKNLCPVNGRPYLDESKVILEFLNEKTGKKFRQVDSNLSLIIARLKTGVDVQTCKTLIARKVRDWSTDPKMSPYLRPETLFNKTKFETYLAEVSP